MNANISTHSRLKISTGFLIIGLISSCICAKDTRVSNQSETIVELTAQADRWDKAIVRKDRQAIESNMTEDFRQIDGQGNVETKQPFVDDLMSSDLTIDPYTVEDFDVRLYGDVALLSGQSRLTGMYQGRKFSSHYRYIDIYVRKAGEWKVVSVQISKFPN